MLPDEDQFLHAVAVLVVPIVTELRVLCHHLVELVLGHRGIPLTGIAQRHLTACLLEDVADVFLALEIADALGTDDALGPLAGHELVEQSKVQRAAGIVDKGADAVLLGLALVMVVVVMMVIIMGWGSWAHGHDDDRRHRRRHHHHRRDLPTHEPRWQRWQLPRS